MYIIGIDEVGRGALAGPVVVAALAVPMNLKLKIKNLKLKLKDSKKLSPKSRELWFKHIKEKQSILYAVARIYPKKIDSINITTAANLAAVRAFNRLTKNSKFKFKNCKIFLDGGLFLTNSKIKNTKTIIKGDEKINAIKLASIVAKVTRDRYMIKLHEFYPRYGLNIHKGYGTKFHIKTIKKYGYSCAHRKSFRIK